jgi:hypothetical protein
MLRLFAVCLLLTATLLVADEKNSAKLAAPEGWSGETIELPPGFAPDMKLKGAEHIRFAPGMMKPASDSFFSYAFVFELQSKPDLTEAVVKDEFLKYYRGLCKKVLDGKAPDVDPSQFTLELQRLKSDAQPQPVTQRKPKRVSSFDGSKKDQSGKIQPWSRDGDSRLCSPKSIVGAAHSTRILVDEARGRSLCVRAPEPILTSRVSCRGC